MCGIIGINENNKELVRKAGRLFCYRGPDISLDYSDGRLTLGHHRLSIVDLEHRSDQPFWDEKKEIGIVYNGEIYNFKKIREELSERYNFRSTSDTEVLVYAYKEWGVKMTEHIEGMFAFAIYDIPNNKVLLARDHRGIKPLYYYAENGVFIFSSELKGITKVLKEKNIETEFDRKAIELYLTLGYIPSPYTLYQNIKKLPRNSYLEYNLNQKKVLGITKYPLKVNNVENYEEYTKLVEKKILDHLIADVPVGVFFSGGTDSSLVTAVLHKYNIDLETFSIKIDYKSEDYKYFKQISEHLNLKSNVYNFDVQELDEVYEEVMSKIDEPSYDNSIFPTYFVSKKASQKVKVVLSGEGGDEFFYGYPRSRVLKSLNKKEDYDISFLDYLFFLTRGLGIKTHIYEKLFIIFKKPLSFYLLHMGVSRDRSTIKQWKIAKEEFKNKQLKPIEYDQELYLENDLLRKIDFATSYVSIEGRVPLLDVEIIENAKNFEEEKLKGNILKAFLKKILAIYMSEKLVYRSKGGFGLDMVKLFRESKHLKSDFLKAVDYLKERKVVDVKRGDADSLMKKYPHYAFSLVSLYRSLLNNEKI